MAPPSSPVEDVAQRAAAELRHAYREGVRDWNLVARAIALLESATTPGAAPPVFTLEEVRRVLSVVEADSPTMAVGDVDDAMDRFATLRR